MQNRPAGDEPPSWADRPEEVHVMENDAEWRDDELPTTVPSGDTVDADRRDARAAHDADAAVDDDATDKAPSGPVDPEVSQSYREATERGANVKGEGQIS